MHRAYKYRIYPSDEQKVLLSKTFGCIRVIWNKNVSVFNSYDKETNPKPVYQSSTEIRAEFEWMKEVSSAALQQKEIDFKKFKTNYFNKDRKTKVGRPAFRNKDSRQSYRLPNQKFTLGRHSIKLEKIGWVPYTVGKAKKRSPEYRPKKECKFLSVTVSRDKCGRYFASVLVDENIDSKVINTGNAVGIDLGLKHFLTLSNGEKIENPKWLRKSQAKLRMAQKSLSRKVKGSVRYNKNKRRLARIHSKVTNQRKWFHHKVSKDLMLKFDFIGIEDLDITKMLKNRRLARSISDAGWAQFIKFLVYKCGWNGKVVVTIDKYHPSSKACSSCGWIKADLMLHDRVFECNGCGCIHDRDVNAAINILKEMMRILAQGVACA